MTDKLRNPALEHAFDPEAINLSLAMGMAAMNLRGPSDIASECLGQEKSQPRRTN